MNTFHILFFASLLTVVVNGQNSLNFDGIDDKLNCGNNTSVQISGTEITLEAWIYPTSWKANVWEGNIINKEQNGPDNGYMLRCGDGGKLNFNIGNNGWNEITSSAGALTLNTWQHVAGTYDGTQLKLYVNGLAINSLSVSATISSTANNLTIGNWSNSSTRSFAGNIEEVRIWNSAKNDSEISIGMNSKICAIPSDLVAYYQLDEGVASGTNSGITTAADLSGNNNTGTLTDFALSGTASNWVDGLSLELTGMDTRAECNSFVWIDGNTYTANNNTATFNIVGGSTYGCDSLVTLNLTIGTMSTTGTDTRTECNSIVWIDGNTYTTNNNTATFNIVGGAASGCDSLVTLDLTITPPVVMGTDTRTECDSFVWIDGNTYTTNNNTATFNIVGGSASGCDSSVTLDLTIISTSMGTDTRTECDSFVWIDGNTYTTDNNSAIFNIVGGAANGCDSSVTLNLTISSIDTSLTQIGALLTSNQSGVDYQWLECPGMTPISGATNQSYIPSSNGSYAVVVSNTTCEDTSKCYTVTGLGITENNFGPNFVVYPNPTQGNLSINLGNNFKKTTVTVTDLSGRVIQSSSYKNDQLLDLNLEGNAGVYLLTIESKNKKAVIKLVKK